MFVGLGFCAYVVLLYLLRGSEPFDALGTSLGITVLVYLIGALVSGVAIGLLLPIGRSRPGAMLLGALAVFPMYKGASFVMAGFDPWSWSDTVEALVLSLAAGSILGLWAHRQIFS